MMYLTNSYKFHKIFFFNLVLMVTIGWNTNLCAHENSNISIAEDGKKENIKFDHLVYTTKVDKDGFFDCHDIYAIDPVSKINILQRSDFMMSAFLLDTVQLPKLPDEGINIEANLSRCGGYESNMSVISTKEDIEFINKNIISIERNNYFFGYGAAHGLNRVTHFTYARKDGRKLVWDDLFEDKGIDKYILDRLVKELASMGYLNLMKTKEYSSIMKFQRIDPNTALMNFKINGYYAIEKEGLKIQYHEYEITPYSGGEPSLIVPRKILKKYMYPKIYDMCFSDKSRVEIIETK